MKKSTMILSALLLGSAAFSAQAQFYLSGSFNDYTASDAEWALPREEGSFTVYRGTFEIPASNEVKFQIWSQYATYEPAAMMMDEKNGKEIVQLTGKDCQVVFDDDLFQGYVADGWDNPEPTYWVINNWEGGQLEVVMDLSTSEIVLSIVADDEPVVGGPFYIVGTMNEGTPTEDWQLMPLEDNTEIFRLQATLEAGDYKFNIGGIRTFVPGVVSEGEVETAGKDVDIYLLDGSWSGPFAQSLVPDEETAWNLVWEGGAIEFTLDFENNELIVSSVGEGEEPGTATDMYIAGNFNEYTPMDDEIWNFGYVDVDLYRGTFTIPAGNVDFYISRYGGNMVVVPGELDAEGEVSPLDDNFTVDLSDGYATTYMAQTTFSDAKWIIEYWEGGQLEITLDFANNEIQFSAVSDDEPSFGAPLYISGNFNDDDPQDLEIWSLNVTDSPDVYRGTFTLEAADVLNFNFVRNGGWQVVVPGVMVEDDVEASEENVDVVLENGMYEGYAIQVGGLMSNAKWVINNWEGGDLEITIDFVQNTISISLAGDEEPSVLTDLYISGNFNEYNPADLEIWNLAYESENVYSGVFQINYDGDIEFDIVRAGGRLACVPGELDPEGEPVPAEDNVTVDGSYSGLCVITSNVLGVPQWVVEDWVSGNYLRVTLNVETNEIIIVNGGSSAVGSLNSTTLDGAIYNLQGVRVDANKANKGIYIINGKKVLVK